MRRQGAAALAGDVLVVICPGKSVPHEFREGLVRYVEQGGKLLVLDSPGNPTSTANSLLWPFGLSMLRAQRWQGQLSLGPDWPNVQVEQAYEIAGGEPVATLGPRPVVATAEYGKGRVMAAGCGNLLKDAKLGFAQAGHAAWMADPDDDVRLRNQVLFALVRSLVTNEPAEAPSP
jgi:hypothetical protein